MWALSAYTGPTSGRFRSVPARSPTDTVTMAYDCSGDPSLVAPSHVNGYFQTLYGTTNRLKSYYFADGGISPSSQYDLLFTGIVKPVDASLLSATGGNPLSVSASIASPVNMCELMAVGDTSTAANVSVWVWQGGRILMATGAAYNASTVPLVGAREVVIGLQLHPTLGPRLYVNGALKTSSFAGWKNISDNSSLASPPLIAMNATQAKRGLFLGSRTVYTSGTAFNVAYKSWRVVNTSGMTDAQVENTQLYRIFFRAVAAREIGSSADNGAPSGTIKVLRDGTNTVLQAVNPNGSQGGSIVISSQPSTRSKDGNISSTSIVGVSLEGFQTEPLPAEDPRLAGIADNTTPAPDKHSLIRATTHDLVLAGNNVLPVADPGGRHGRVVTLGELHAYKGTGRRPRGETPSGTPNADLSLESGDQLRLSGRAVVAHSQSSFKFLPGGPLPPPDAWLEIARKDDPAGIALSTSASLDMVVKPGTGRFGVEADSVELGAGDVRYKFVVVNALAGLQVRVRPGLAVLPREAQQLYHVQGRNLPLVRHTDLVRKRRRHSRRRGVARPQPKMRASGIRQRAMTTANREVNNLTVGDTITFGNGDRLGATNPFAFGSFGHFASTYDDAGEPVLEYRVANPAAPGGYDMFFRVSRDQSPAAVVRVWTPVCQEKTGKSNPVVLVDTVKKRLLSVGVGAKEHVMAFADRGDAKRFAIAARVLRAVDERCTTLESLAVALDSLKGWSPEMTEEPIHLVTGLRCIDVPPDLLMKYCSYSSMAVYFASERPERDVIISEGVFRVHPRGSGDFLSSGWSIEELAELPPDERPRIQTGYLKTVCFDRNGEYNVWRLLKDTPPHTWDSLPGHCILRHQPAMPRNTQVTAENDLHNLLGPLLALLQLAHLPPQGRRHPTLRGLALIADADGEWAVNLAREPAITITHDDGRNVYREEYALNGVAHLPTARDWANDQLRYILNPLTGRVDRDRRALTIQNLRAESGSPPPEDSGEGGDYVPGTEQGEREVWTGKKGRKRARKTSGETAPGTSRSHAAKRSRSESPLPPSSRARAAPAAPPP
eukprot:jgi/Mesvir1/13641/Mv02974-RA.1